MLERKRGVRARAVGWWRRRATDAAERVPLRRTGAVSCGVLIGALLLVRVFGVTPPRVLLALVFTVFVVVILWCQWRANEMDDGAPVAVLTGLPSRFARMVAVLRREHTRDTVREWLHAAGRALGGIPPPDVSPPVLEDSASGESSSRHAA
ncbi:MAG TPA: hypothetical protein VG348_11695 [Acidimicrobiia bacterium]|nr:hypothetical protein [Acidimicrobiia bacterium]